MWGLTCLAEVLNVVAVCLNADRTERGEAVDQRLLGHLILNPALNLLVICIDYNDEVIQLVVTGCLNALPGLTFLQLTVAEQNVALAGVAAALAGMGRAACDRDGLAKRACVSSWISDSRPYCIFWSFWAASDLLSVHFSAVTVRCA